MQPTVVPIAAAVIRRQKEIVSAFRDAHAVSSTSAVTPASLGIAEKRPFHQLTGRAVLREVGDGRYYLDDFSWNALREKRRRIAIAVIIAAIAAVLIVLVFDKTRG